MWTDKRITIHWLFVFIIASILLSIGQFKSTSNDSNYYTDLVIRYHDKPLSVALTPKWGENTWGFNKTAYMQDQMPGQLMLGIALTKIGVPPTQALHILEMGLQILSVFILVQIVTYFTHSKIGLVLLYTLLLIPLAFSYNIRANHESGILFFSVLSLYAGLRLSSEFKWKLISVFSIFGLMWIKGPFLLFGFILTSLGFFIGKQSRKIHHLILTFLMAFIVCGASGYLFENFYRNITNESFFKSFYDIQITQRTFFAHQNRSFFLQKFWNFQYYLWHYLVYSMPWSLMCILYVVKNFRRDTFRFMKGPLSKCLLSSALIFLIIFTFSDRSASRYAFPGYYLMSTWFILFLFYSSPSFRNIHEKIYRLGIHYVAPTLWFLAFVIHFIGTKRV
jgi:4-amino-4-deoxy-L-arabinose transferase-like glycosyltransferase